MAPLTERLRGRFIAFDGPDGCGKGTQIEQLAHVISGGGVPVTRAKDPGGTPIGDRIRHILLDFDLNEMDVHCEALLFMASRAQLAGQVIRPALAAGHTVLCDRFISATCAYQGAAGYDPKRVLELAKYAIDDTWPDMTVIIDVPPEMGFERTGRPMGVKRPAHAGQRMMFPDVHTDAMESRPLEFHRRVRGLFLELANIYPRPVTVVSGEGSIGDVHRRVLEALERALG